jgi:hypothetical protein
MSTNFFKNLEAITTRIWWLFEMEKEPMVLKGKQLSFSKFK